MSTTTAIAVKIGPPSPVRIQIKMQQTPYDFDAKRPMISIGMSLLPDHGVVRKYPHPVVAHSTPSPAIWASNAVLPKKTKCASATLSGSSDVETKTVAATASLWSVQKYQRDKLRMARRFHRAQSRTKKPRKR